MRLGKSYVTKIAKQERLALTNEVSIEFETTDAMPATSADKTLKLNATRLVCCCRALKHLRCCPPSKGPDFQIF